jgi:DNA mismatch repair protein MutL
MPATLRDGTIRLLDEETINQIAAGEVVERPASVVKELVENALDAGAASIRVEISSDTREIRKVQVTDDGHGMDRDNALRSFLRHATSKLTGIGDLSGIRTMGFRGEALASIAAVARVTMITKPRSTGPLPATRIGIAGGEILSVDETGAPDGTTVVVEDLFFNTPARKKFVKSIRTEISHIYALVEQISLAHPEVAIRFVHNGQEKIRTPRSAHLLDTIAALYGSDLARDLIPVHGRTVFMEVSGYLAKPSRSRPGMQQIEISVNDRQISSLPLARAIRQGYGTLLMKDRYPVAFLHLTLDRSIVDVNVHPTKKEIRLSRESEITQEIARIVRETLTGADLAPEVAEGGTAIRQADLPLISRPPETGDAAGRGVGEPAASYHAAHRRHAGPLQTDARLRRTLQDGVTGGAPNRLPAMRVIGQLDAAYILATTCNDGRETLLLIDQHAAHERILYEIVTRKREKSLESQELITPVVLTLRPRQAAAVRGALHLLMNEGFILEEFGTDAFAVRTVPVVLGRQVEQAVIEDIISDLLEERGGPASAGERKELITTIIACRGAIKAGDMLSQDQMERLVAQLFTCEQPYTCPHGRPTIVSFPRAKLDGLFRRT